MYHEITLVGTIGREPELRYTPDGKASCSFSVATNRAVGQGQQETTWFKVTTWEKTAEFVHNYAHKGNKILAVGRLVCDKNNGGPRLYQKQDGTTTAAFEVVAEKFRILDNKQDGQRSQQNQQTQYQQRPAQQQAQTARPAQQTQQQQTQAQQAQFTDDIPW